MNNQVIFTQSNKKNSRTFILLSDFGNIVKAFIGANYLTISYAFTQSGLLTGIILLIVIATITDHCCQLIVKCKYQAISNVSSKMKWLSDSSLNDKDGDISNTYNECKNTMKSKEMKLMHQNLVRNLTYGDIGKLTFGSCGLFIVNACIFFTQFGFCIAYFIFIGNTIYSLFPTENSTVTIINNGDLDTSLSISQPSMPIYNISKYINISTSPDLRWLVLTPVPLFIGFALIRDIRHLGVISVCANLSILVGGIVTLAYITIGFSLSSDWHLYKWSTLPIFFGMVTSSFEGIGTIIPIESSMEGNRHNFAPFLHSAVIILSIILTTFGVVGYLRFGETTEQILNNNIPTSTSMGMAINICLCVGVFLTFPLQIYPVIEISEFFLFKNGHCNNDEVKRKYEKDDSEAALLPRINKTNSKNAQHSYNHQVHSWKRNILRICIVLVAAGLAVALRDFFAYVSAFVGALGSSLLAYILPCLFHLKLCGNNISFGIRLKDYSIIVFGILASIISLYTTIKEVVDKLS
ncbi:hypothetical protein Btru_004913 [Bulinus truncatus]|nr:hypothetical protein Btru_004913 [Bulinus truncatus]